MREIKIHVVDGKRSKTKEEQEGKTEIGKKQNTNKREKKGYMCYLSVM